MRGFRAPVRPAHILATLVLAFVLFLGGMLAINWAGHVVVQDVLNVPNDFPIPTPMPWTLTPLTFPTWGAYMLDAPVATPVPSGGGFITRP